MGDYLKELSPVQLEAVQHVNGPSLVIAGAGSGKTRVLTYKIAHLLDLGIPAWSILSLTFTNKAVAEMKERIVDALVKFSNENIINEADSMFESIGKELQIEPDKLQKKSKLKIKDEMFSLNTSRSRTSPEIS